MKKIYKLLGVILLTFFVGMINVKALDIKEVYFNNRGSIGSDVSVNLNIYDENIRKKISSVKAYFTSIYDYELPVEIKNKGSSNWYFTVTEDFTPERHYSLAYLEIIEKDGTVTRYSPFESGEYIKIDCYKNDLYIKEKSPIKNITLYTDYDREGQNKYYKNNDIVHYKIETNFDIDSGTIIYGDYYDYKKDSYSFDLKKLANDIYEIDLSKNPNMPSDSFGIKALKIVSNGKTYEYGKSDEKYEIPYYDGSVLIYKDVLKDFSMEKEEISLNEKVYVNLSLNEKVLSGEIKFKGDNKQFTVSIRDLDTKPYIIIPYTAKLGEYELDYISLTGKNPFRSYSHINSAKYIYSNNDANILKNEITTIYEKRDYHNKVTIVKDESTIIGELLELDNDLITDDVIKEIKNVKDGVEINIDASNNTTVKSEVFEAIKGHDKTLNIKYNDYSWTFNGKDITEPKKLKVNFAVADFKKYEEITKAVKNGALVVFANYGALPGKATIRFNIKEELAKEIKDNKLNLYMYDSDETQKFELIDTGIKQDKEGFYEIKLSNTSSYYVVTPEEIADKYLIGYNFPILLVVIIILSIITVIGIVVLIILKVRKGKKKKKVNKEETPKVESSESVEKTPEEEKVVEEVKKDEKEI